MFSEMTLKTGTVPFFAFSQKKKGRMDMKLYEALWSSVSILIGAVLAGFAFVSRAWQPSFFLVVFLLWGLWVFCPDRASTAGTELPASGTPETDRAAL